MVPKRHYEEETDQLDNGPSESKESNILNPGVRSNTHYNPEHTRIHRENVMFILKSSYPNIIPLKSQFSPILPTWRSPFSSSLQLYLNQRRRGIRKHVKHGQI